MDRQQLMGNRVRKIICMLLGLPGMLFVLTGCSGTKPATLMSTPVIYTSAAVDPFAHLAGTEKSTRTKIYYATNRIPLNDDSDNQAYGNSVSEYLHLGKVTVRMGDNNTTWEDLYRASTEAKRPQPVPLYVEAVQEQSTLNPRNAESPLLALPSSLQAFVDEINGELNKARDKEIILYVHGTKNSFENAVVLTAELDYFSGRDYVGFAFAWPSHQNILSYFFGVDVKRALHSTLSLHTVIDFLARYTVAEHINLICYSAGGKVASQALYEMHEAHADLTADEMRRTFRLGTVVFAAADVPLDLFLKRLPAIAEMAQNVVVTVSDADGVLRAAADFMGGAARIGSEKAGMKEDQFVMSHNINNFEIIDLSHGKKKRGFDITGHHYWYRHPWASSDIIFLLRTDLPAGQRGLSPSGTERVWYLDHQYPEKIRKAAEQHLNGQW
jgi:esterase/lipase superfamily enzyme